MRPITGIIVHCTATRPKWWATRSTKQKVAEIRRWHVEDRGWSDIGYHYLIDRNGSIATGRPLGRVGAHVKGHNRGTIGIALFGGHGSSEEDKFSNNFTAEQDKALRHLITDLRKRFPGATVTGHNQYAAKACPGFHVPTWWAGDPMAPSAPIDTPAAMEPGPAPTGWAAFFAALAALFKGKRK